MIPATDRTESGEFPSVSWPGCYPLFYATKEGEYICPDCANKTPDDVTLTDVNWENALLFCAGCSGHIPCAYPAD